MSQFNLPGTLLSDGEKSFYKITFNVKVKFQVQWVGKSAILSDHIPQCASPFQQPSIWAGFQKVMERGLETWDSATPTSAAWLEETNDPHTHNYLWGRSPLSLLPSTGSEHNTTCQADGKGPMCPGSVQTTWMLPLNTAVMTLMTRCSICYSALTSSTVMLRRALLFRVNGANLHMSDQEV